MRRRASIGAFLGVAAVFGPGGDSARGQEVEIISGAPPIVAPGPAAPGIRVIAFVETEPERVQHRVMSPLLPEEILIVQEWLAAAGQDPGARDGILGESTTLALTRFQDDSGLEPCGCVDYPTVLALGLSALVVQTVLGAPEDESGAEIVVGNNQLPQLPTPEVIPVAPPETVTVIHQAYDSYWSYPAFFPFPSRRAPQGGGAVGSSGGIPFGPVLRLGASRTVPPRP